MSEDQVTTPAKSKIEDIPVSLETIRRKVMMAVHAVERETAIFTERYMSRVGDHDNWNGMVEAVCEKSGKKVSKLVDFKDLDPLLNKMRLETDAAKHPEFNQLRRMVERGKMFEYIAFSLRNDLADAHEKMLEKYCISFIEETKGEDLISIKDQENQIRGWSSAIKDRLDLVDSLLDECDKYKHPVSKYINDYDKVLHYMTEACKAMIRASEPMKRWVVIDSTYPRKIQEEINIYNKRKMDLRDIIKQVEFERDQLGLKLKRKTFFTLKMEKKVQEVLDEKRHFKRREGTVKQNYMKAEAEIQRKKRDLDEIRGKIRNRKDNSPTVYNYLVGMAESERDDIHKMEVKLDVMQTSIASLKKDQYHTQKEMDRLSGDLNAGYKAHQQAAEKLQQHEHAIRGTRNEVRELDRKLEILKRIREIKLHSDTIKKIYHFGYNPGQMLEMKDELHEAMRVASEEVGKDWVWMYHKLPFAPPRDFRSRTQDIEMIDISNRRVDGGFRNLTMKSLEKWRRISRSASVQSLVNTLRSIRKHATVKRIRREIAST